MRGKEEGVCDQLLYLVSFPAILPAMRNANAVRNRAQPVDDACSNTTPAPHRLPGLLFLLPFPPPPQGCTTGMFVCLQNKINTQSLHSSFLYYLSFPSCLCSSYILAFLMFLVITSGSPVTQYVILVFPLLTFLLF